jgi:hypothetical protein
MPEAATPTGAETAARADVSAEKPSVHERLKAFLNPAPEEPTAMIAKAPEADSKAPAEKADAEAEPDAKAEGEAEVTTEDAETDENAEATYSSLDELAEALGWDLDKVLDLTAKTKIDGKEDSKPLRDLIKSHQLEGHLNQKLMTHAEERKAFEAERLTKSREMADKLLKLDAGLQTLQRALAGEYATVDWQKLQEENPLEFNAQYVRYQQRYAQLQDIGNLIAQEQQKAQQEAAAQAEAYLREQKQLLHAKIPEWSDDTRRNKDKAEILDYLKVHGISKEEFEAVADHRQALVIRDAWNWHKLQKAKPIVLNKVKAAPKLLKPGAIQSRAAQDNLQLKQDQTRLRSTGKVLHAKPILKKLLFNS